MNCPICSSTHLNFSENTDDLYSFTCPKCSGKWIRLNDYLKWLNLTNKSEYELFIKNDLGNKANSSDVSTEPNFINVVEDNKPYSMDDLIEDYAKGEKADFPKESELFLNVDEGLHFNKNEDGSFFTVIDSKKAKLCPDCGRILIKYKVNSKLDFTIEHCGACSGIWFDEKKWDILSNLKLNDKVYRFFTEPWQRKIREESTKSYLDKKYNKKFGDNDYEKLKTIKAWIDTNNNRREIIAYLLKNDPYKIN